MKNGDKNLTQEEVKQILKDKGKESHYLFSKSLNEWDKYDLNNFNSINNIS